MEPHVLPTFPVLMRVAPTWQGNGVVSPPAAAVDNLTDPDPNPDPDPDMRNPLVGNYGNLIHTASPASYTSDSLLNSSEIFKQ